MGILVLRLYAKNRVLEKKETSQSEINGKIKNVNSRLKCVRKGIPRNIKVELSEHDD
ncbi:MAG: hypothetical protein ACQEQM_02810 [Thermoplasmatota archaeon]